MFSKRSDGKRIKNLEPFTRVIPMVMKRRSDSMNFFTEDFNCEPLDIYIREKRSEGIELNYMKIIIAVMTRVIAERPMLNRFVMNGYIYKRPKTWVSFAVQKSLRDEKAETTVKLELDGTESVFDVSKAVDEAIDIGTKDGYNSDTDKLAGLIMSIPGPLIKLAVNTLMFLDKHNCMPKFAVKASPFHTTFFITNLKSLGINHIFHHIYDFGTTGIFISFGKERKLVVPSKTEGFDTQKTLTLSYVLDERICDGLYYAKSIRLFKKYMSNPSLLEECLSAKAEDVD